MVSESMKTRQNTVQLVIGSVVALDEEVSRSCMTWNSQVYEAEQGRAVNLPNKKPSQESQVAYLPSSFQGEKRPSIASTCLIGTEWYLNPILTPTTRRHEITEMRK